jgi:hypothetical protein
MVQKGLPAQRLAAPFVAPTSLLVVCPESPNGSPRASFRHKGQRNAIVTDLETGSSPCNAILSHRHQTVAKESKSYHTFLNWRP